MSDGKPGVLFVCLGNICRSPAAEGNFLHLLDQRSLKHLFTVDSAGTSAYHIGEPANANARRAAEKDGVKLPGRARQFKIPDFDRFDYILAMDRQNHQDILSLARRSDDREKVMMFRKFDPEAGSGTEPDVPDPYFGGMNGFAEVQSIMRRTTGTLLDWLLEKHKLA